MNKQFFQTLLTKKGRFLNGENPSPSKLSAIIAQIENGFSVIESFLGNGSDYLVTTNDKRKMLGNVSSAIGKASSIYKPVNKFHSLEQIKKVYMADQGTVTYTAETDTLDIATSGTINIDITEESSIGILFSSDNDVTLSLSSGQTAQFTPPASGYGLGITPLIEQDCTQLTISCTTGVSIKSLIVGTDQDMWNGLFPVVNIGYAIPLSNNTYFRVRTPCKFANPSNSGTAPDYICADKTCDYCIGNTYDLSTPSASGTVICEGAKSITDVPIDYVADSLPYKTLQSPLLTEWSPYMAKYMPFKFYGGVSSGVSLPENSVQLYDAENNATPVIQNVVFYSASSQRGDIFLIKDQIGLSNSTKRYMVIGGDYGIAQMMQDMLDKTKGY